MLRVDFRFHRPSVAQYLKNRIEEIEGAEQMWRKGPEKAFMNAFRLCQIVWQFCTALEETAVFHSIFSLQFNAVF